jgi:peptidoglycan/xylan/chitin deacetylase (PgdA/CDA1 family)
MRLLSPILHRVIYPVLGSVGYFHSRPAAPVTVITYHGVLPAGYRSEDAFLDNTLVSEASFRSQLRLLKKHYNVISPECFLRWLGKIEELPERAVLLTCDDGLLNHLTTMVPVLREEELKCLFFVTGSSLGDTREMLWYVELYLLLMQAKVLGQAVLVQDIPVPKIPADLGQRRSLWLTFLRSLSQVSAATRSLFLGDAATRFGLQPSWKMRYLDDPLLRSRFQLLRLPELKQLRDAGMTVGAHTLSHPVLTEQAADLARVEIEEFGKRLGEFLGQPVWALAYPFGDPASVGEREIKLAADAGYTCAFVNVGGVLNRESARFALPRIHVTAEMSLPVYEAHVSGVHNALRSRMRLRE